MQELRLIGVHEDGAHLLLAGADGTRYRVPLDDSLRAAARRDRPRLGQLQIEIEGGLRPREVQGLIRAGLSTQEVADRSGWSVQKVERFEGPVLAEREHVAQQAQQVRLRHRGSSSGPALSSRVEQRLASRDVSHEDIAWDAWRPEGGDWVVAATYPAGGKQRRASWTFDQATQIVTARDDEARWLTEDDPADAAVPATREEPVYDVDADGGLDGRSSRPAAAVDLMAALRERSAAKGRKGRRRGLEAVALPLGDEAVDEPVAPKSVEQSSADHEAREAADETAVTPTEPEAEVEVESAPLPEPPQPVSDAAPTESRPAPADPPKARKGRPSVPSWDDIVFGRRDT